MTLPYDVARCACWWVCPVKRQCARFTDPGDPKRQACIDPSETLDGKPCEYFIANERDKVTP
jgi:hypothetical protein